MLGERAIVALPDGTLLPCFDAGALPYLRLSGAEPLAYSVSLSSTSTRSAPTRVELPVVETSTRSSPLGPLVFVRTGAPARAPEDGEHTLELLEQRPGCEPRRLATRRVRFGPAPEALPALAALLPLERAARWTELRAILEPQLAGLDPWTRVWAAQKLARAHQAEGDPEASARAWSRAAALSSEAGVPTQASWALRSQAFQCMWLRCAAEAALLLDRAEELDRAIGNRLGLARGRFYRGSFELELGRYRSARELLDGASVEAGLIGRVDDEARFSMALAVQLAREGRAAAGLALLSRHERWFERSAGPVDRSKYWSTLGWLSVRALEGHTPAGEEVARARVILSRAREMIAALKDPLREANVLANLGFLAFVERELEAARQAIAEIARLGPVAAAVREHPDVLLLEASILELSGEHRAAAQAFRRLEVAGREESDYSWRARYGEGRLRRAQGDHEGALAAFLSAIEALEIVGRRTVLQDSRAIFFADRRRIFEDTIVLLLSEGRSAEAFAIADRAHSQLAGALELEVRTRRLTPEQATEWARRSAQFLADRGAHEQLRRREGTLAGSAHRRFLEERARSARALARSFDALHAYLDAVAPVASPAGGSASAAPRWLAPGEALIEHTLAGGEWHSFFVTNRGVEHAVVDEAQPFAPWVEALASSPGALYLAGAGPPAARGAAALVLPDGRRLIEVRMVSSLPHAGYLARWRASRGPAGAAPSGDEPPSLVIADPTEDLPGARGEGRVAHAALPGAKLLLGEEATREVVLRALRGAGFVHFAGHGVLVADDPWAAHLGLARDERLTLEDVLASPLVARMVVLGGCETGRAQQLSAEGSVGLAEAFLAAGAGSVLATERAIGDAEGARFFARFYAEGGARRPADAYRAAILEGLRAGELAPLEAFRWFGAVR